MTPHELGDSLARLVWESFSDFMAEGDVEISLTDLLASHEEQAAEQPAAEEALIFHMWAHTRGTQLAFIGREADDLVRRGLDIMHRAVFEDMVSHGTPRTQLSVFEQRVSTRYAEYASAAEVSDTRLARLVLRYLTGAGDTREEAVRAVVERAIAVANPLRDFLEDVELIG